MSIYYNPQLVKLLNDERIREARESNSRVCCATSEGSAPRSSIRSLFRLRRQSPAACTC
jgi:hypothetical protein